MGISVEMFCKQYKAQSKGHDKTFMDFLKKHIVVDYVPYIQKDAICAGLIKATCHIKDGDHEIIKINSANRYLFFTMKLVQLYTDIDIEEERIVEQYDELKKVGAIDMLVYGIPESKFECIPHAEYTEFSTLLNMKLGDFIDNEYNATALLYNIKQSFSLSEEVITSALEKVIKDVMEKE